MAGYDSFEPNLNFILVTNTRRINTPTHSDRFIIAGSLHLASLSQINQKTVYNLQTE